MSPGSAHRGPHGSSALASSRGRGRAVATMSEDAQALGRSPPRGVVATTRRSERGQASVELVAALPVLILAVLVMLQLAVVGYSLWSAGTAARAGARAGHVGGDAVAAARSALPGPLEHGAKLEAGGGSMRVRVLSPALVPGLPRIPVEAASALGAGDG